MGISEYKGGVAMKRLVFAVLFVSTFTIEAHAWMNTTELQAVCESALANPSPENPPYALCTGLGIGILWADALEQNLICLPSEMTTKEELQTFISRASKEPHKDIEGVVIMYRSLLEKYPCSEKK
jgi:hypothetical protein